MAFRIRRTGGGDFGSVKGGGGPSGDRRDVVSTRATDSVEKRRDIGDKLGGDCARKCWGIGGS
jgi:hypothetical protein